MEPVRGGGATLPVRLTGPFLLPFDEGFFIADSPYLLKASEDDWRDHLARVVARRPDAIAWLRQQERILRSNPQLAGPDNAPLVA